MADPIKPQTVDALKKDSWWLVPAIENISEPDIAEINAALGFYITCFLLAEQEGMTSTTEKAQRARLLCEDATPEVLGATTWSMSDLTGVFSPQASPSHPDKAAFEFLRHGYVGKAVRRQGVLNDLSDAVTLGQYVDVIPVSIAPATPTKTSADQTGFYSWVATVAITGRPAFNVAVVDGGS